MIALCIEFSRPRLEALRQVVEQSPDITGSAVFEEAGEALEWAARHSPDVVFLPAEAPGLDLAARLRAKDPLQPVVFCADSGEQALAALRMHANGYLLRPIQAGDVQAELDHLKLEGKSGRTLLTVRCNGGFTVLDRLGQRILFRRRRTAELLALLLHSAGVPLKPDELCGYLWEDNGVMLANNRNYLRQLLADLRAALTRAGADQVIRLGPKGYWADLSLIRLEDAEGPYLPGYAWARGGKKPPAPQPPEQRSIKKS